MKYMLDTDISSYFINASHVGVVSRMQSMDRDDVCISAITKCELLFGLELSQKPSKKASLVGRFLGYIQILDLPSMAAQDYAEIRAELQKRGRLIGSNDMLLAAHARHLDLTLVTNNTREFSRVPGLKIENWVDEVA